MSDYGNEIFSEAQMDAINEIRRLVSTHFNGAVVALSIEHPGRPNKDLCAVVWSGGEVTALGLCAYAKEALISNIRTKDQDEEDDKPEWEK